MDIFERVLERRIRTLINLNKMQFGHMQGKGRVDAIFIVRRMLEEHQNEDRKLYKCFVYKEKAFDRVPRKMIKWAIRKKSLLEAMVRAALNLNDGIKTRVRMGSAYSEEFE